MHDTFCQILHDQCLLAPGERVLVAVSGGADSVVLLHLFVTCAARYPLTVFAAHLDHGLRPESAADAVFVRTLCERFGIPLVSERIAVPESLRAGNGLEAAAREVRRDFLRRVAADLNCGAIALGHHRDDQAETVLLRLLRGSGPTGLAAMRPRRGPFIRPLLDWPRSRLRGYLEEHGLPHVEDVSNADPLFTRNRLRHEVLPLLRTFNPALEEHLAHLADRLSVEEAFWDAEVDALEERLCRPTPDGLMLPCPALLGVHPALRTRLLRSVLRRVRGDLHGIDRGHLQCIEKLLAEGRPQREIHLPGAWVARRYERLLIAATPPALPPDEEVKVIGVGSHCLPDGGTLTVTLAAHAIGEDDKTVEFPEACLPLTIRTMRPGDRFQPSGMVGHKKLKDFFIDNKIALEQRRRTPLVVAGEILWVVGLRRCEGHRTFGAGERVLRVGYAPPVSADNPLVKTEGLW